MSKLIGEVGAGGARPPAIPQPAPSDPRLDQLHQVLSDPRFQYQEQSRPRDLLDSISDIARAAFAWYGNLEPATRALGTATLLALLAAFVAWLATRGSEMTPLRRRIWIVGSGGAVFLLAIIFFIIWGKDGPRINVLGLGPWGLLLLAVVIVAVVGMVVVLTGRTFVPPTVASVASAAERNLSSAQSSQRAIEQAAAGNYRDAIRYLYLTTLILLDERGLLRFDHSLTNREYLQRLGSSRLAALLTPIVDTFDRTWYGHTLPSRDEYDRYASLVEAVKSEKLKVESDALTVGA
ncbi:MAG: hypothetical protein DLM69_04940 [Candidatus Chloroheliales bacterium]|nr:MAG: hypothetical protein DLM69_04940 [Chloroflexota bacterium]